MRAIEREQCRRSFHHFVRGAFPIIEKGRKFVDGWMVRLLCRKLQDVAEGRIRRLVINVPPGTMKSLLTEVFLPAWCWGPGSRPNMRFLTASYSPDITIRDNRRCRDLVKSAWYRAHWGHCFTFAGDQDAKTRFDNSESGFKIATSVGGMAIGERGDVFVIDDPHKPIEVESDKVREAVVTWGTEVVPTRVVEPEKSAIVLIMQRLHEKDLAAHYIALGFEVVCLPMRFEADHPFRHPEDPRQQEGELLFPERYPLHVVEEMEKAMSLVGGDFAVSAQFQQRPVPRGGGLFKREWFRFADAVPEGSTRVRGWDFAASTGTSSAWTAGVLMARSPDGRFFVEDVVRLRGEPHEVRETVIRTAETDGHSVIVSIPQDPGQSGKSQVADFVRALAGYDVRFSGESGSKEARARPLAAQFGGGNVYLQNGIGWAPAYTAEMLMFPRGPYKDQVDASSRAFAQLLSEPDTPAVGTVPPTMIET